MNAEFYVRILEKALLPSTRKLYLGTNLLFMQDNDPKHTSRRAHEFFANNEIEWWKTPPESPDLNPIENLWHELKECIRREVKPKTKADLIAGVKEFWETVDTQKCQKYIGHLKLYRKLLKFKERLQDIKLCFGIHFIFLDDCQF